MLGNMFLVCVSVPLEKYLAKKGNNVNDRKKASLVSYFLSVSGLHLLLRFSLKNVYFFNTYE